MQCSFLCEHVHHPARIRRCRSNAQPPLPLSCRHKAIDGGTRAKFSALRTRRREKLSAANGFYQAYWSEMILDEALRNLVADGRMSEENAARLVATMRRAFPEAQEPDPFHAKRREGSSRRRCRRQSRCSGHRHVQHEGRADAMPSSSAQASTASEGAYCISGRSDIGAMATARCGSPVRSRAGTCDLMGDNLETFTRRSAFLFSCAVDPHEARAQELEGVATLKLQSIGPLLDMTSEIGPRTCGSSMAPSAMITPEVCSPATP
jgi:hypothetical protein